MLFIMPPGVCPGSNSEEWKRRARIGIMATGTRMFLLKGRCWAGSPFDLRSAVGASPRRVTRRGVSAEARNWYFVVRSDFK